MWSRCSAGPSMLQVLSVLCPYLSRSACLWVPEASGTFWVLGLNCSFWQSAQGMVSRS